MKKCTKILIAIILVITTFLVVSCHTKQEETSMMDQQQSSNPYYSRTDTSILDVPNSTWKKVLPSGVYAVAREKDTERAFTGKYWNFEGLGTYYCAVCGNRLFRSDAKFASTCGWPSFFETCTARGCRLSTGWIVRDEQNRSAVRAVRKPSRSSFRRRPPSYRKTLLHELHCAGICAR